MNYLDIIILIPLAIFVFKGLRNGLILEVASLAALFIGIFAGIYLSDFVSGLLIKHFGLHAGNTSGAAFVLIFIAVIIVVRLIAKSLEKALDITPLGIVNKLLGAMFAALKILFVISLVFYAINKFDTAEKLITHPTKEKSFLYKPVAAIAPLAIPRIKAEYAKLQEKDSVR
jgi:membrane protein required for colicin V production